MNRRFLICALGALTISSSAWAQSAAKPVRSRIDVVKLVDLSCSVCESSEALDANLSARVQEMGGKYVVAPLALEKFKGRERIYYALRDLFPGYDAPIRKALYSAATRNKLMLQTEPQAIEWLVQEGMTEVDWSQVTKVAASQKVTESLDKALALASVGGISTVPAWIILENGKYKATIETFNADLGSARDQVLSYLK